jgi:hypothetical protein
MGSSRLAPPILNLGARWRRVVNFTCPTVGHVNKCLLPTCTWSIESLPVDIHVPVNQQPSNKTLTTIYCVLQSDMFQSLDRIQGLALTHL